MSGFTASAEGKTLRAPADGVEPPLVVVALCAAWCNTCADFRPLFERIAAARGTITFVWLDIEDDAELCGDLDVESFPTVLAFRGERVLHYGVTLPIAAVALRLIDELALREGPGTEIPEAATALCRVLGARGREKSPPRTD